MTDEAALLAAVAAAPDDDLPRLVFADWLDERGQTDRAEFVRAQVRLAATDPWEPFAVLCRHRHPEWVCGDPWRGTLPKVDGWAVEWHPDRAFRRGFGWSVIVRDVRYLLDIAPRLFAEAPIGELHLPTATLDEYRQFARAEWLPRVKSVHFYSTTTPVEPVRELCRSPLATGIEEIVFEKSSGAGMPVLLGDVFRSPLGKQLRRLELRVGPDDSTALFDELTGATDLPRLRQLALVTVSPPSVDLTPFFASPVVANLNGLEFANVLAPDLPIVLGAYSLPRLTRVIATGCGIAYRHDPGGQVDSVRMLDLSKNPIGWNSEEHARGMGVTAPFVNLRCLALRETTLRINMLGPMLSRAASWPNLVELDLRNNQITDTGARHLLDAPVPADLTALLLDGNPISDGMWTRLRGHFGEALVHTGDET